MSTNIMLMLVYFHPLLYGNGTAKSRMRIYNYCRVYVKYIV